MKKCRFYKMSGSGNDFVVIDNRRGHFPRTVSVWAKRLCHRQEGIGADGLLLLEHSQKADFRMVYFNSDGSRARMCGNGGRCMAWIAHHLGAVKKKSFIFESDAGLIGAWVDGTLACIQLSDAQNYRPNLSARALGKTYPLSYVDTGVPHAVCLVRRLADIDVRTVGQALRFHSLWGPQGANINFVERVSATRLKVRTYERGVEGETLACGTGVAACGIVMGLRGLVQTPVHCQVHGGDVLEVNFLAHPQTPKHPASAVTLKGPVRLTYEGEIALS